MVVELTGAMGVAAVFLKKTVLPNNSPMKRSRSPSASASAKAGLALEPTSLIAKGLVEAAA